MRTDTRFRNDGLTVSRLDDWSRIHSDTHRVQVRLSHWIRQGLRVNLGYDYDEYIDDSRTPSGVGSADPFDPSTHVHTVMFGVTLNSDLLR
jgi:outer membrane receptor for ferric coprogen and ferric-rhodotorulic acid